MDLIKEIRKKIEIRNDLTDKSIILNGYSIVGKKSGKFWEFSFSSLDNESLREVYIKVELRDDNSIFLHQAKFYGLDIPKDFVFLLEDSDRNTTIVFEKCRFVGKLKIRNREIDEEGKPYPYEYQQKNKARLKELKFVDCEIIKNEGNTTPYLRIGYLDVENFELVNLRIPNDTEVNIGDCRFRNFKLSNIRNLGKFKLYKINIQEGEKTKNIKFQIDNTSIGDTDFQGIDLSSFELLKIFDNILSGINYTNITWGNHIIEGIQVGQCNGDTNEYIKKIEMEKKRDTYRILKNVALKNNDIPQVYACYAKEMEYHHKIIKYHPTNKKNDSIIKGACVWCAKIIKSCYERIKKILCFILKIIFSRSTWSQERITLGFSRLTSNFGQSWLRPIILIFGFGALFYTALLVSLCLSPFDFSNWNKFVMFLNPIDGIDFVDKCEWSNWSYFWGFSFRIIEGLLIYQAIQAFRRYSRKF